MQFSRTQIKRFDRVGGANLILDWPADLPPGKPLPSDHEREATAIEWAAATGVVAGSIALRLDPNPMSAVTVAAGVASILNLIIIKGDHK